MPIYINKEIAYRVEKIVKRLGVTQTELARRTGLSLPYVNRMINGTSTLRVEFLMCLAMDFHVSIDYILTGEYCNPENIPKSVKITKLIERRSCACCKRTLKYIKAYNRRHCHQRFTKAIHH